MAHTATLSIAELMMTRLIAGKTYKMVILVDDTTNWQTAAVAALFDAVNDVTADEATHVSYARQTVTLIVSRDNVNLRSEFHFNPVTFPGLAALVGQIFGIHIYEQVTNDTDHIPAFFVDVESLAFTPTGNDLVISDASEGLVWLAL